MKIFVDTSGLFASLVKNDIMHAKAGPTMEKLLEEGAEIHVTSYVLLETMALLQARVGLEAASQFEHVLRPLLLVHWVDESLHEKAFKRLELRGTRGVSLVDCTSFVTMEDAGIRSVFAYDEHFTEEGFHLVGTQTELDSISS